MKKILVGLIAALVLVGCVDVSFDSSSVCNTTDLGQVPANPVNLPLPPQTFSTTVNVSDMVSQMTSTFDTVQLIVTQMTLSSDKDLSWLQEIDVTIDGGTSETPNAPLAYYQANGNASDTISFQLEMKPDVLLFYLQNPVTLHFTVTGNPTNSSTSLSETVCVDFKAGLKKSL